VSFPQLYAIFKDAMRARAHVEAIIVQSEYLPRVMEDTCEDALACTCSDCGGTGRKKRRNSIWSCPTCRGTGKVRQHGSIENRKLVFESAGLTGKRAPLVAQQFNVGELESLEETLKWAREILDDEGPGATRKDTPGTEDDDHLQ
jgi:hypothetical protein